MGRFIVQLAPNEYVEWSTVVDAPVTYIMDKIETYDYMWDTSQSDTETEKRIERLEKRGTTELISYSAKASISGNRAGPNEEQLTLDAIRRMYLSDESAENFEPAEGDIIPWED